MRNEPSPTDCQVDSGTGRKPDHRAVVVVYEDGQEDIIALVADVLGKPSQLVSTISATEETGSPAVFGIAGECAKDGLRGRAKDVVVVINTRCMDARNISDKTLSDECDYEFLYTHTPFLRRDLTRFLSFVLGQKNHHDDLLKKSRTSFISTTFPDVRTALSNLDILSVGSDAVEIRVDLLREPKCDGTFSAVPSLEYVGEQVMLLRQRSELPIIFTTRCTKENGRFPMDNPTLYYDYLYKALQWGCEYIDVELWLPEDIRMRLAEQKGYSKIISAFHDFSGNWKWSSPEAQRIFKELAKYGDIAKMIALITSMSENYELELFRSGIKSNYAHPPLSAVNMGPMGQMSRALNYFFTPVTHPLLPMIAAPGQLSAAEINDALRIMGQIPKRDIFAIGTSRPTPQSVFFEKCFNELGVPHSFACVDRGPKGSVEAIIKKPNFGGAYLNPPLSSSSAPYLPSLSNAARSIGHIDTITIHGDECEQCPSLTGHNASWKGIRATLTRDFVPSAYRGRAALVLSSSEVDASAAIFALQDLAVQPIYTIGFKAQGPLASMSALEPLTSVEDASKIEQPFALVSALPPEKSHFAVPLLKFFSQTSGKARSPSPSEKMTGRVFVNLAKGSSKGDPGAVAATTGWTVYGSDEVSAWTTVEMMRLLVGQNVPWDFVRMASGRCLY
ncbi:MAG: hypothetical protein M1819_005074 [Sarea resinae]|nr:MAG: hypothetical protein M1819_005074 [Sarea resinae]